MRCRATTFAVPSTVAAMSESFAMDLTTLSPRIEAFVRTIQDGRSGWFTSDDPVWVVRAPARLDVMGGIADYTGSLVLELPAERAVVMAVQARDDQQVVIHSLAWERPGEHSECRWPLSWLYEGHGRQTDRGTFARRFDGQDAEWARYPSGVLYMMLEAGIVEHFAGGVTIVFDSTATPRAGIGSSAALEVATCQAVSSLYGVTLDPLEAAQICQRAENHIVGAPCGIMDQVTSLMGQADTLLQLRCQPHDLLSPIELPPGVTVVGINSGVKHQVGGQRYAHVRVSAFMGHRIILDHLQRQGAPADPTRGYLANIEPEDFVERFRDHLPMKLKGRAFLDRYGQTIDPVTRVDPDVVYKVRSRTEHHIYENRRVHLFADRLVRARRTNDRADLELAGQLMYSSHWSYGQRCGLGSIETDVLCNLVRERGPEQGFYGAKISGGGAGGTVVVLMDDTERCHAAIEEIMATYRQRTGLVPECFRGSSPGASEFGVHRID